jgi:hypothetical protein
MKTYLQYLIFICLFSINTFSQKKDVQLGDPNDLDQKYVPDKNSVLNSVNSVSNSSGNRDIAVKNIIKFNLTLLGRGAATVFWEHPFGKVVSLEGGLGLCFNRDFMQSVFAGAFADAFSNNGTYTKYLPLNKILTSSIYAGTPSVFVSGGVKLYFADDAPEGSYFSFNIRYYANNLQLTPPEGSNTQLIGNSSVSVRNLSFNVIYGYQVVSGGKNVSFVNDFYFGFGMRRTGFDGVTTYSGTNNNGGFQTTWAPDGTTQSSLAPVFLFGYSLGFGF